MIRNQKEAIMMDKVCWISLVIAFCVYAFYAYIFPSKVTGFILILFSCIVLAMIVAYMLCLTSYVHKMQSNQFKSRIPESVSEHVE